MAFTMIFKTDIAKNIENKKLNDSNLTSFSFLVARGV